MKIALFLPSLRGGGAEKATIQLAQGFLDRRYSVDLLLAQKEGPYLEQIPESIRVVDFHTSRIYKTFFKLAEYLRKEKPSVLISQMDHVNILSLCVKILFNIKIPVIVCIHGIHTVQALKFYRITDTLLPFFIRFLYPHATAVVAVSTGVAENIRKIAHLTSDKVHIFYNPVICPELFRKASEPVNESWINKGDTPVIISIGRLNKVKGFTTLVDAFAIVRKKKQARLVILGEGEERHNLETKIKALGLENDVLLPGFVQNPYKYLKNSSVFVLSSIVESFGIVLVEALALGVPVVSTDCPTGPREILEGGKWGTLVPVENKEIMAEAIVKSLISNIKEDPFLNQRLENFERDNIIISYEKLFKQLQMN